VALLTAAALYGMALAAVRKPRLAGWLGAGAPERLPRIRRTLWIVTALCLTVTLGDFLRFPGGFIADGQAYFLGWRVMLAAVSTFALCILCSVFCVWRLDQIDQELRVYAEERRTGHNHVSSNSKRWGSFLRFLLKILAGFFVAYVVVAILETGISGATDRYELTGQGARNWFLTAPLLGFHFLRAIIQTLFKDWRVTLTTGAILLLLWKFRTSRLTFLTGVVSIASLMLAAAFFPSFARLPGSFSYGGNENGPALYASAALEQSVHAMHSAQLVWVATHANVRGYPSVLEAAIDASNRLEDQHKAEVLLALTERASNPSNFSHRNDMESLLAAVFASAVGMEPANAVQFFDSALRLAKDKNGGFREELYEEAAKTSARLGHAGMGFLNRIIDGCKSLEDEPRERVLIAVAETAGQIGGAEGLALLQRIAGLPQVASSDVIEATATAAAAAVANVGIIQDYLTSVNLLFSMYRTAAEAPDTRYVCYKSLAALVEHTTALGDEGAQEVLAALVEAATVTLSNDMSIVNTVLSQLSRFSQQDKAWLLNRFLDSARSINHDFSRRNVHVWLIESAPQCSLADGLTLLGRIGAAHQTDENRHYLMEPVCKVILHLNDEALSARPDGEDARLTFIRKTLLPFATALQDSNRLDAYAHILRTLIGIRQEACVPLMAELLPEMRKVLTDTSAPALVTFFSTAELRTGAELTLAFHGEDGSRALTELNGLVDRMRVSYVRDPPLRAVMIHAAGTTPRQPTRGEVFSGIVSNLKLIAEVSKKRKEEKEEAAKRWEESPLNLNSLENRRKRLMNPQKVEGRIWR
jgi:hypothetical protein